MNTSYLVSLLTLPQPVFHAAAINNSSVILMQISGLTFSNNTRRCLPLLMLCSVLDWNKLTEVQLYKVCPGGDAVFGTGSLPTFMLFQMLFLHFPVMLHWSGIRRLWSSSHHHNWLLCFFLCGRIYYPAEKGHSHQGLLVFPWRLYMFYSRA